MAWNVPEWKMRKTYLDTNKEVFDTELYAIGEALEIAVKNGGVGCGTGRRQTDPPWTKVHV